MRESAQICHTFQAVAAYSHTHQYLIVQQYTSISVCINKQDGQCLSELHAVQHFLNMAAG